MDGVEKFGSTKQLVSNDDANVATTSRCTHILRSIDDEQIATEYKSQNSVVTELLTGWESPQNQPTDYVCKAKKRKNTLKDLDRRTSFDFRDGLWKDSIEYLTYRYVPNNGCYREMKTTSNSSKSNSTQGKRSPKVGLTTEQRKLQKEISRDLRREFQDLMNYNQSYFCINSSIVESNSETEKNDCNTLQGQSWKTEPVQLRKSYNANEMNLNYRCSTNLDLPVLTITTKSKETNPKLDDLMSDIKCSHSAKLPDSLSVDSSQQKSDSRSKVMPGSHSFKSEKENKERVAALAQETFSIKKVEHQEKLKPIGKSSTRGNQDSTKFNVSAHEFYRQLQLNNLHSNHSLDKWLGDDNKKVISSLLQHGITAVKCSSDVRQPMVRLEEQSKHQKDVSLHPRSQVLNEIKKGSFLFLPAITGKGVGFFDMPQ